MKTKAKEDGIKIEIGEVHYEQYHGSKKGDWFIDRAVNVDITYMGIARKLTYVCDTNHHNLRDRGSGFYENQYSLCCDEKDLSIPCRDECKENDSISCVSKTVTINVGDHFLCDDEYELHSDKENCYKPTGVTILKLDNEHVSFITDAGGVVKKRIFNVCTSLIDDHVEEIISPLKEENCDCDYCTEPCECGNEECDGEDDE